MFLVHVCQVYLLVSFGGVMFAFFFVNTSLFPLVCFLNTVLLDGSTGVLQPPTWNPQFPHRNFCPRMAAKITVAVGLYMRDLLFHHLADPEQTLQSQTEYSLIVFGRTMIDTSYMQHVASFLAHPKSTFDMYLYGFPPGLENSQGIYLRKKSQVKNHYA